MSGNDAAEKLKRDIVKNTPETIDERNVNISHDVVDMTGEMRELVHIEVDEIPEVGATSQDRQQLTREQLEDLREQQEEFQDEIKQFRRIIASTAEELCRGNDRLKPLGYHEYEPSQGGIDYYTIEVHSQN